MFCTGYINSFLNAKNGTKPPPFLGEISSALVIIPSFFLSSLLYVPFFFMSTTTLLVLSPSVSCDISDELSSVFSAIPMSFVSYLTLG